MAIQGNLIAPVPEVTSLQFISPIPAGDLITPYVTVLTPGVTGTITNRFPVPPTAWGFTSDLDLALEGYLILPSPGVTQYIMGAVTYEGKYMEPTIGQIWPR